MQPSAGPDHPHTRSRLVHWLATTAALAAVVGTTAVLQPQDATASSDPASLSSRADRGGPDPERAEYPMDCGPWEPGVVSHGSADFDGDGVAETVAVVRCATEGGTPPSGVYVLTVGEGEKTVRVARTLVDPAEKLSVDDLVVRGRVVAATLRGYSSEEVPRCCPDQERAVKWRWADGDFTLSAAPVAMGA